ncbi:MAG: exodeoxyribonuclease V subunit gamma [Buchnera aphidicola (Melaphis rhois)]
MLILYKSYNLNLLVEKACSIFITNPLSNPLENEIFITPNKQTDHWIKIFIAKKYSIISNIKFLRLNKFFWKIFQRINTNCYSNIEFEKYYLTWKIMNIKDIKNLTNIISKNKLKSEELFEIASFLSKCFEKYLLYRPDWIQTWENNPKYHKNTDPLVKSYELLWTTIISNMKNKNQITWNHSNLLFLLQDVITHKKLNINQFPSRIFIFGNVFLTPYNIIMLNSISKLCSIHFFYVTPYQNEKQMLLNQIKLKKHKLTMIKKNISYFFNETEKYKQFLDNTINKKNNINDTLLWNKYRYEQYLLLSLINKKEINIFNIKKPICLLQKIQRNIIKTNFYKIWNNNKKKIMIKIKK